MTGTRAHPRSDDKAARPPTPRLRLKPKAPATGYVDGAWWPKSRDLTEELPELVEVLGVRLGRVERVAYAMAAWTPPPRRFAVDGQRVRLEGFTYQNPHVIYVTGTNNGRISLLVVPPDTEEAKAHEALLTAAHRGNADRPAEILAVAGVPTQRVAP
jgi:hypothetical protein